MDFMDLQELNKELEYWKERRINLLDEVHALSKQLSDRRNLEEELRVAHVTIADLNRENRMLYEVNRELEGDASEKFFNKHMKELWKLIDDREDK